MEGIPNDNRSISSRTTVNVSNEGCKNGEITCKNVLGPSDDDTVVIEVDGRENLEGLERDNMNDQRLPMEQYEPAILESRTAGNGGKVSGQFLGRNSIQIYQGSMKTLAVREERSFPERVPRDPLAGGRPPTMKKILRPPPKVGDKVFAMHETLLWHWVKGTVVEILRNEVTNEEEYIVQYEPTLTKNGMPAGWIQGPNSSVKIGRQLTLREMAYTEICSSLLPVGARIIAKCDNTGNSDLNKLFYAGVVAEPAKGISNNRYLVFFDGGYANYISGENIRLVYKSSPKVWEDVHPNSYDFIEAYVRKWPDWPMVKLSVGQLVATELNSMWCIARALEVYCSLAKVKFINCGRYEVIYRGSGRFRPVSKGLLEQQEKHQNTLTKMDKERLKYFPSEIFPFYEDLPIFTGNSSRKKIDLLDSSLCIEYQGTLKQIKIPETAPKPKSFVTHNCNESCVINFVPSAETRQANPLVIPLSFGWNREVCRRIRHSVIYRAPCGRRLRDENELARFLDITGSNFSIDYFSFDYDVDCLSKFVPVRALFECEDVTDGKGLAPLLCVNSIDEETPPKIDYIAGRVLGPDVKVNDDEGFLQCCDCTDNCLDETKCACAQLTLEGYSFKKFNDEGLPVKGYEFRRLKDQVKSGIFECNNGCKCKQTCSNRTTQNGAIWPLQVFKTASMGWGVRTLYDMPMGSFVGMYAGEVLSEDLSDIVSKEKGDEYFVQLDYIEVCEREMPKREKPYIARKRGKKEDIRQNQPAMKKYKPGMRQMRAFMYGEEGCYVVDAKWKGNVCRFMNHSCTPNVFAQNILVDTHDMRFPHIAFFTSELVKAGTELTWDYGYTVDSENETEIKCCCNTPDCRGRLI